MALQNNDINLTKAYQIDIDIYSIGDPKVFRPEHFLTHPSHQINQINRHLNVEKAIDPNRYRHMHVTRSYTI